MNQPQLSARSMRALIQHTLCDLGVSPLVAADVDEDLLIRDGRARARTYRAGGFMAMWMLEIGLVQFYNEDGDLIRTYTVLEEPATARRAA